MSSIFPTSSVMGIDLGEYASIKSGSYHKLTKAYYAKQKAEQAEAKEESKQELSTIRDNADSLKDAANKLRSYSLWNQKSVKVKDEQSGEMVTTQDYDRTAIHNAVKSFVDEYNHMMDTSNKMESEKMLRTSARMIRDTRSSSKVLGEVGIKIGTDNKLIINESKLKDASIGTLKAVFEGIGSYADHIAQKAGSIGRSAKGATDTYTNKGTYIHGNKENTSVNSTSSHKADYQISDEMQKAVLEQVKLDYYMYGGNTTGKADSSTYTRKLDKYLGSLEKDKRNVAKDSIDKFREELSALAAKAIKVEEPEWKSGTMVNTSVLKKVFMKEDELLKEAGKNVYGNSFNQSV